MKNLIVIVVRIMNKQGKIIKQLSNDYFVQVDGEIVICKPRGKFRKMGITPLVGDLVDIDYDNRYLLEIEPRTNELIRPCIANVTQALIVNSVEIPEFSSYLLDKLLVTIEHNHIKPIICFTKLDLVGEELKQEIASYIEYYRSIGYEVYVNTDAHLKDIFAGQITVFAGQSGAGKSTLLNRLDETLQLETGEVSKALGRGKHTTRHVELLPILGGLVADTPGFSSLDFIGYTKEDIRDGFIEFQKYQEECQYRNCMHQKEENCEVKRKVKEKVILPSRYENYLQFLEKMGDTPRWKG